MLANINIDNKIHPSYSSLIKFDNETRKIFSRAKSNFNPSICRNNV